MSHRFTFLLTALAAIVLALSTFAREKWPPPDAEAKDQAAKFKQHEQEVLKQIEPELQKWAKQVRHHSGRCCLMDLAW